MAVHRIHEMCKSNTSDPLGESFEGDRQVDEPAIQVDEPEIHLDELAIHMDEPEIQVDEPAIQVDEAAIHVDGRFVRSETGARGGA